MKKLSMVVLLVTAMALPAWSMPALVEHTIDHTMKSDIRPVEDTGRILDVTNRGVTATYNAVTEPMAPVLNPVRKVSDTIIDGSKKVINTTWDVITLKHFRD